MDIIHTKESESGVLHDITMKKTRVYNIFTKAGNYRGGKVYSENKFFVLLSGKCELLLFDGQKDCKTVIVPGEIHTIEAATPNLFYFSEDTEMIEWFTKDTAISHYERYREMKK